MRGGRSGGRATEREAELRPWVPTFRGPSLQLAVTRKGVGLELTAPGVGALMRVDRLEISLRSLRFPVDLSGGVERFRHRRGQLVSLSLAFPRDALERAARIRLSGIFAEPRVTLLPEPTGIFFGIAAEAWALAAHLRWAPDGEGPRFVLEGARASGLSMPAHEGAMLALSAMVQGVGERSGSYVSFPRAAPHALREALLDTGARVPDSVGLLWGKLDHRDGEWRVALSDAAWVDAANGDAAAAVELATLLLPADEALSRGDHDAARALYLSAWERAPKHPSIARRVAEIDEVAGRPEAGLAMLTTTESAVFAGALGGALLERAGDREGAREALSRSGEIEAYAPLAALCLGRAAGLCDHPGERAELLRAALSRAPTVETLRWRRLEAMLELGDERGARAEAEGVSAVAPSARRFEVAMRLGQAFLSRGHGDAARFWFERSLLFSPRAPEPLVGLGEAMMACGAFGRATEVLARAIDGLDRAGRPSGRALLALGRALAEGTGDLPLAIARVRGVRSAESSAVEARYWEGTWLSTLGDRAEASLAYVRMHEAEERSPHASSERAAAWLGAAARFEREDRGDLALSKRHLGLAIRRRSRDPALLAEFRRVARELDEARTAPARVSHVIVPPDKPTKESSVFLTKDADRSPELPATKGAGGAPTPEPEADDAELAERLTDRLRGNPNDLEVALELCGALERLGRDMDLLGVISARLDEGDEATRAIFRPLRRTTLSRLAGQARTEGREGEATLYESMRDAPPPLD